jgi:hypothetical protein
MLAKQANLKCKNWRVGKNWNQRVMKINKDIKSQKRLQAKPKIIIRANA